MTNSELRQKKHIPVWIGYFSQAPSTFAHTIFIQNGIQYNIYIAERSRIRSSRGRIKSREKKEEKRKLNESISLHAEKPLFKQSYLFGVRKKKIRIVSIRERHQILVNVENLCVLFSNMKMCEHSHLCIRMRKTTEQFFFRSFFRGVASFLKMRLNLEKTWSNGHLNNEAIKVRLQRKSTRTKKKREIMTIFLPHLCIYMHYWYPTERWTHW